MLFGFDTGSPVDWRLLRKGTEDEDVMWQRCGTVAARVDVR